MDAPTLLVAAGGTGGHLYPAIAVAERFRECARGAKVIFVGSSRGLESRIVPEAGFPLELVRVAPLRGGSIVRKVKGLFGIVTGIVDARRLLRHYRPSVVMGVGAYVSGTVLLLSSLRGIPTLILEPNAEPGLANRLLGPFVDEAACAFEETTRVFGRKGVVTGNPVRDSIALVPDLREQSEASMRVLVFGGSQGSSVLNRGFVASLGALAGLSGLEITHQTGPSDHESVRAAYTEAGLSARVTPYIEDMAEAYGAADLVVARAGATTCAELSAAGRGSLLIPLPLAGGHQERNAEMMAEAGAARFLRQSELTPERLASELEQLARSPEERASMARAARALARPDAARTVAEHLVKLAKGEASS